MGIMKKLLYILLLGSLLALPHMAGASDAGETSTKKEVKVVDEGKSVKVHYTLKVEGKIVESSTQSEPLEFQVGNSQMISGFERALMGMKTGDKKSFQVNPDDGYGQTNPEAVQEVPRDKLPPDITPEAGMTLYARDSNEQVMQVRIAEVKEDVVVMDFNHPLAGKILNFDVEIVEIQ
jgi:FKBP-type peptidyl-prolyl cis-trans isomerase 2